MASKSGSSAEQSSTSSRQTVTRQTSDTHAFPARDTSFLDASKPRGLSESTKALARQVLYPEVGSGHDYSPGVFSGGTKWLLDSVNETEKALSTPRKPSLLTETAVKKHNEYDPRKQHLVLETDSGSGFDRNDKESEDKSKVHEIGRTNAWISQQSGDSDADS